MIEKLRARYDADDVVNMSNVESNVIKNYGAKLVVDKLLEEYELDEYLTKVDKKVRYDLESMIKLMVMNRLLEPKSKLGIEEPKKVRIIEVNEEESVEKRYE